MADSIVVLYRGGRLPSWHQLSPDEQVAFQDEHVDLMLTVGARHGLQSIEGFRLLAPRGEWERWWTIRFPDLAGAEAWMRAEVAPPYGRCVEGGGPGPRCHERTEPELPEPGHRPD